MDEQDDDGVLTPPAREFLPYSTQYTEAPAIVHNGTEGEPGRPDQAQTNQETNMAEWQIHPLSTNLSTDSAPSTAQQDRAHFQDYFGPHFSRPGNLSSSRSPSRPMGNKTSQRSLPERSSGSPKNLRRIPSSHSDSGRGRQISHSKSSSTSQLPARSPNSEVPVYPDQSFTALQHQFRANYITPVARSRSSHPPALLNTEGALADPSRGRLDISPSAKTADNTPITSPGLFAPSPSRINASEVSGDDHSRPSSPRLHPMHKQRPKTTTVAEVDRDMFTGNKYINEYEIIGEIGRGQHGKVKLGRRLGEEWFVAIKIVPRRNKHRLLAKLGAGDNATKREVAILKRARHPNIVALYEVIDDPSREKVYLVLEYVQKGEIRWRKRAPNEILAINKVRFERERSGVVQDLVPLQADLVSVEVAKRRHEQLHDRELSGAKTPIASWSLEHSEDTDGDSSSADLSRTMSHQVTRDSGPSRTTSQDELGGLSDASLAGSMYGPYTPEDVFRHRAGSLAESAISHMSSEFNIDLGDQGGYVPALTFDEIRKVMLDSALGIEFLHSLNIVHRDIKPMNLLVTGKGEVKISDFGASYLGRPISEDEETKLPDEEAEPIDDERELARTVGTPAFWAPELCYNSMDPAQVAIFEQDGNPKVTAALDLWSLGVTLYAMVYAKLPFYESQDMSLYESICQSEVFLPQTRLKAVDATNESYRTRTGEPMNSNKRLDYELAYEHVSEDLRSLITQLLIKDPSKRMSVHQLRNHPWVWAGVEDPSKFADVTNLAKKETALVILDPDEKEVAHAVVKRSFVERGLSVIKGFTGSLLGRKDSRKRAISSVTSASMSSDSIQSSSTSSGKTLGKAETPREARRASLRGDEIIPALKASRDAIEHPLAQSQTASPDEKGKASYFPNPQTLNAVSTGATLSAAQERRPHGPERSISSISTADSVETIRAPQPMKRPALLGHPEENETTNLLDAAATSLNFLAGTAKRLTGMSRERKPQGDRSSSPSRQSSLSDGHAEPSLAISTASAHGDMRSPGALYDEVPPSEQSITSASPVSPSTSRASKFQPPESSEAAFEHAQEMNRRRYMQETKAAEDRRLEEGELRESPDDCPPSPDDVTMFRSTRPSDSTLASSEGFGSSGVSQSISNPRSGVVSNASSPPVSTVRPNKDGAPTEFDYDVPDFMSTAETITAHTRPPVATGRPLEEMAMPASEDDENADELSDDDEVVMMAPRRG